MEGVKAMNVNGTGKGCSGHIGKMVFSAGDNGLAIVAYVPDEKHTEFDSEKWLQNVTAKYNETKIMLQAKNYSSALIPVNNEKGVFPFKIREDLITAAIHHLRSKSLLPEDESEEEEYTLPEEAYDAFH